MAKILIIGWLIAGFLLSIFSGFLYYNDIITQEAFFAILLLGIGILILTITFILSWEGDKKSKNEYSKALLDRFNQLLVLSIIIFGIGLFGYLLTLFDIYEFEYEFDSQPTFFIVLIVGLLSTLSSFISWKYVKKGIKKAISDEIDRQNKKLYQIMNEIEDLRDNRTWEDDKNKINELIEKTCINLFTWDNIPGDDNEKLIDFLKQNFGIDWIKTGIIEKIDNVKTIKVSTKNESIFLKLNDEQTEVNLSIHDGNGSVKKTDKLIAITKDGIRNIYYNQKEKLGRCKEEL